MSDSDSTFSQADESETDHAERWSYELDPDAELIRVNFAEAFSLIEIDSVAQSLESAGHEHNRLFNFQACTGLAPTTTELLDIARRSADWDLDGLKVAWLAASRSDASLLRIVASKFSEQVMKVFTSEPEAIRWLSGQSVVVQDSPGQVDHHPVRLRGQLNAAVALQVKQALEEAKDARRRPLLWDLRDCQVTGSLDGLKEQAVAIAKDYPGDSGGRKNAILVDSHFMDMIVRELGRAVEIEESASIVIFRSYRDAIVWLAK